MKKLLLATSALVAMSAAAVAADLPNRKVAPAPVYAAPIFTWTGFYAGAQLGWQQQNDKWDSVWVDGSAAYGTRKNDSLIGGVHAGYNHQIGALVLGVEADAELANAKPKHRDYFEGYAWGYNAKIGPQGSLRARVGYAIDKALIYATGGLAIANVSHTFYDDYYPFALKHSETKVGWTLGAGLEYALTNNWSTRVEYRYTDLGKAKSNNSATDWASLETNKLTSHAVRIGLTYKFGGPAPVVAKY